MKTGNNSSQYSILSQLFHNTSSWIGHYINDTALREAGQVFQCPENAQLERIEVFSELVQQPGNVQMKIYRFDEANQQWGSLLGSASLLVKRDDTLRWVGFNIVPLSLQKGENYGFILRSDDAFVALGEAAWPTHTEHHCGKEWTGINYGDQGQFYDHFSLAYKIDLVS